MKKLGIVLLSMGMLAALAACGSTHQTSQKQSTPSVRHEKKQTSSSKQQAAAKPDDSVSNDNQSKIDTFMKEPWTFASASEFLQKVYDSSPEGKEHIGLDNVNLQQLYQSNDPNEPISKLPANSAYVLYANKSGAGDGGFGLTKNDDRTVTVAEGSGYNASVFETMVVDLTNYHIVKKTSISEPESMMKYFGLPDPTQDSDNSNSDNNQTDTNDETPDTDD